MKGVVSLTLPTFSLLFVSNSCVCHFFVVTLPPKKNKTESNRRKTTWIL